jgi:hypothetical protein
VAIRGPRPSGWRAPRLPPLSALLKIFARKDVCSPSRTRVSSILRTRCSHQTNSALGLIVLGKWEARSPCFPHQNSPRRFSQNRRRLRLSGRVTPGHKSGLLSLGGGMRKVLALALTAILAFAGGAGAETLIRLDYGWRSDGKASCTPGLLEYEPWRRFACLDPVADLENYATKLDAQFLSNSLCHGITFIKVPPWGGPGSKLTPEERSAILKHPHWWFLIYGYNTWRLHPILDSHKS